MNGKKSMTRRASDNKYLHKDFHLSMNILLNYIYNRFGEDSVIRYLAQYTKAYHQPLHEQLQAGNMDALRNYLEDIYQKEEWTVSIRISGNVMEVVQEACPGITTIKSSGGQPCPCYVETYRTVYETLCDHTPFRYELKYFDDQTGACTQLFIKNEEETL
jgi:hypothetical protein